MIRKKNVIRQRERGLEAVMEVLHTFVNVFQTVEH
jgi:hypothetical protein